MNRANYDSDDLYYKAIKDLIENRTISERIYVLRDYYYMKPKDSYVLIRLTGIKGDIDCKINDIDIYTPNRKTYITDTPTLSKIEQIIPERNFINAAIPVKHKMLHSSVTLAIQSLEKIIDLLALTYNTSKPIGYSPNDISVIENGSYKCGTNLGVIDEDKESKHREFVEYISCLDISKRENDLKTVGKRISAINNVQTRNTLKLTTAAHWFQKGKYTQFPEDRLLFHWIAIESLLKTDTEVGCCIVGHKDASLVQIIQKIATAILVKRYFHNYCFNIYLDINHLTINNDNYLDIPHDVIEKASLNMKAGDKVEVSKFLKNISEIEANINDEILKIELRELQLFYMSETGIKNKEREIKNDILLIYRLRNLIAHNAVYPKYLIDFYATILR